MLGTLAQVAAALLAVQATVVTFAITLTAQRADAGGGPSYVPFLARRAHVFLLGGVTTGVALASVAWPALGNEWITERLGWLLWLNAPIMVALFAATVWLIAHTVLAAAGSGDDWARPVILSAMRDMADHHRDVAARCKEMLAKLEPVGVRRGWAEGQQAAGTEGPPYIFGPQDGDPPGKCDPAALVDLLELVPKLDPGWTVVLLAWPGSISDKRGVLHVRRKRSPRSAHETPTDANAPVLSADECARLHDIARRLLRPLVPPHMHDHLVRLVRARGEELEEAVRTDKLVEIKKRLDDCWKLQEDWLNEIGPALTESDGFLRSRTPKRLLEIEFHDIVRAGVARGDAEVLEEVLWSVLRRLGVTKRMLAVGEFDEALGFIGHAFAAALQAPALRDRIANWVDERIDGLNSLCGVDEAERHGAPGDAQTADDRRRADEIRVCLFRFVVRQVSNAVSGDAPDAANKLLDRLVGTQSDIHIQPLVEPVDLPDLKPFALVVLVGWCVLLIAEHPDRAGAARALLPNLFAALPDRPSLMSLWERVRPFTRQANGLPRLLDFGVWDPSRDDRRIGTVYSPPDYEAWLRTGFWAAVLGSRGDAAMHLGEGEERRPSSLWEWELNYADQPIQAAAEVLKGIVGEAELRQAQEETGRLVEERKRAAKVVAARHAASAPISADRVNKIRRAVEVSIAAERARWEKLLVTGQPLTPATTSRPDRVVLERRVPRQWVIDVDFGVDAPDSRWGREAAELESRRWFGALEKRLSADRQLEKLSDIGTAVESAVALLRERGFRPDVVVLPPAARFASALLGADYAQPSNRGPRSKERARVGVWHGLLVVASPMRASESILVLDRSTVVASLNTAASAPLLDLTDAAGDERDRFKLAAQATNHEPPDASDLKVGLSLTLEPHLGYGDLTGAVRVGVLQSDGCYLLDPEHKLYHRATCPAARDRPGLVRSMLTTLPGEELTGRQPCPRCKPAVWDVEAHNAAHRAMGAVASQSMARELS